MLQKIQFLLQISSTLKTPNILLSNFTLAKSSYTAKDLERLKG